MPIKRLRDPDTLADVAGQYLTALGYKEIMHLTGRSKSMPYKWADPDNTKDVLRDIDLLVMLDAACIEAGKAPPFYEYIGRRIAKRANGSSREAEDLIKATLDVGAALGHMQEAVQTARDKNGPGGTYITPNEAKTIKQAIKRLHAEADDVDRAVDDECAARLGNVTPLSAGAAE